MLQGAPDRNYDRILVSEMDHKSHALYYVMKYHHNSHDVNKRDKGWYFNRVFFASWIESRILPTKCVVKVTISIFYMGKQTYSPLWQQMA